MKKGLVVLPTVVAPMEVANVAWYSHDEGPSDEVCSEAGFFVPTYLGVSENASKAKEMPNLEVMQLLTIGYDYATELVPPGVTLCNAQGVHEGSTAELALGLVIASMRRIDASARDMSTATWDHRRGASLQGAHVLVIGAGPVGTLIAQQFSALSGRVTLVARTARAGVHSVEELASLLPGADVVVMAVPLTQATTGMVDSAFLAAMKTGALLVNVARGLVVDTTALVTELETGRLSAALDVTDPEPLPANHRLWALPNVLITPHVGGDTDAFPALARSLLTRQIQAWREGEPLVNVVSRGPVVSAK